MKETQRGQGRGTQEDQTLSKTNTARQKDMAKTTTRYQVHSTKYQVACETDSQQQRK